MKVVSTIVCVMMLSVVAAGCTTPPADQKNADGKAPVSNVARKFTEPTGTAITKAVDLVFDNVLIVDKDHAGGEPVLLVTKTGAIILTSHPGYTHLRGPDSDLVTSSTGQAFMWRSADGGKTWTFIGLPVVNNGPRNAATSVSDPDLTMRPDGGIVFTTLQSLVSIPVEVSTDDGKTWSGQPLHGPPGVDRNWVQACNNQDVYQVYSSFTAAGTSALPGAPLGTGGRWFAHSTDGGNTWTDQHATNAGGNLACDQLNEGGKYLYIGGGTSLSVSTDKGKTFKTVRVPGRSGGNGLSLAEPAVDAAGNVYTVWIENGTSERPHLYYAISTDHGGSFSRVVEVPTQGLLNGTQLWPWITAKDPGHIGIVWYGTSKAGNPANFDSSVEWNVYSAIIPNALDADPVASVTKASNVPIHRGPICQQGTACQANPSQSGDRRLGDFFTATFDNQGALLIATASTQQVAATGPIDGGGLAHPAFIKQTAGPSGLTGIVLGAAPKAP